MRHAVRFMLAGILLAIAFASTGLYHPEPLSAQLQSCTFGPARPATEGTIFDRQPTISISATCPGAIATAQGLLNGQPLQLEHTGLGTREIRLSMRPAAPLNPGVYIVNFAVDGSVFSWGFTVVENRGNLWTSRPGADAPKACPARGEWLLLYWGGEVLTTIDAATSLCPGTSFIWQYRGSRWLGYSPLNENASDFWIMIERGEAHFMRGANQ